MKILKLLELNRQVDPILPRPRPSYSNLLSLTTEEYPELTGETEILDRELVHINGCIYHVD